MKVQFTQHDWPQVPDLIGAHKLAWSYLLDYIFADTYHHHVDILELSVPNLGVAREVNERTTVTPSSSRSVSSAFAQLSFSNDMPPQAQRIYRLHFGVLAPVSLRRHHRPTVLAGRTRVASLYVYTWQALMLGIPMRLGNALSCPHWADRSLAKIRQTFTTTDSCPAFYRLDTWT